ncbi:MAG: aminotransferase class I/II-fold pyridoxal phosphate-dependent enzyme [Parcubacteria group bacterium]|nr:aminotransferase class I/II-fold pyridoxal phosphate-dependent enzyme [Parcubacteria group bacterium]
MRNFEKKQPPMHLSRIASRIPDFHVLRIDRLANDLVLKGKDVIKLNLGKSEVPMQEVVADEVAKSIYDKEKREIVDAQGLLSLRQAIVEEYERTHAVSIRPDQVFINNGTSPFFLMLYQLLLDPGDEVLLPLPYYPPYFANTVIARVTPVFYSVTSDGRVDLEEFERRFTPGKTRLVVLNSPGNPLGNVVRREEMERILEIVDGQAVVVSDEIYDGFVYGDDFCPILRVARGNKDCVVVLNGFSKIHHMYTRRLGYAIVPQELVEPMLRFQRHNIVCVDPVTQFAGLVSLQNRKQLLEKEIRKEIASYRERLALAKTILEGTPLKVLDPSGSFYMPIDVSACLGGRFKDSLTLAEALLSESLVAVTPGEDFGRNDLFRVGLTNERTIEGIERMRDFAKKECS